MKRVLIPLGLVLAVVGIVGFSAFESHLINITARVKKPPDTIRKVVVPQPLTNGVVTREEVDAITKPIVSNQTTCIEADSKPPLLVPVNTCVFWVLRITVTNNLDQSIDNVVVTDRFDAELFGQPLDSLPVHVQSLKHTRGQKIQQTFITQVRLHWCVTGNLKILPGPDGVSGTNDDEPKCNPKADPTLNQLLPGESQTLDMLVFTKLNPNGQIKLQKEGIYDSRFQEYTTPCTAEDPLCYKMNSGAVAKWVSKDGVQCAPLPECPSTDPIFIGTIQLLDPLTINTNIDFGTVFSGQVVKDDFVVLLSSSFLAAGGQQVTYEVIPEPVPCPSDGSDATCAVGSTYPDITPYITIIRNPLEADTVADTCCVLSGASLNSKVSDTSDQWTVTFTAPEEPNGVTLKAKVAINVVGTDLLK